MNKIPSCIECKYYGGENRHGRYRCDVLKEYKDDKISCRSKPYGADLEYASNIRGTKHCKFSPSLTIDSDREEILDYAMIEFRKQLDDKLIEFENEGIYVGKLS